MKRRILRRGLLTALMILSLCPAVLADAGSTSYTVSPTINGGMEISPDAYLPVGVYSGLGLNHAQDLYVQGHTLYIADSGNQRVIVLDTQEETAFTVGEGILSNPQGVAADEEGRIYVADTGNGLAYRFSPEGEVEQVFERPTTPAFGKNTRFSPLKIAAAGAGGVYIISEDSTTGIIHMDGTGEFLGFFASNDVSKSLFEKLLDVVLTEEQLNQFLPSIPPSYGSIFTGADGLVYTINKQSGSTVQRHSLNGVDLFSGRSYLPTFDSAGDLFVTEDGRMLVVDNAGYITVVDQDGHFLCRFGGNSNGTERVGLFDLATGIGEDEDGRLYVLDSQRNYIQIFEPTDVQQNIYTALDLYSDGQYDESRTILESVLKRNSTSYFVRLYMGQNYMQQGEYAQAIEEFRIAGAKDEYSEAYWELRNLWLQDNMLYILLVLLGLAVLAVAIKTIRHRPKKAAATAAALPAGQAPSPARKLGQDLLLIKRFAMHPIDTAYEVQAGRAGSVLSATLVYLIFFVLYVVYQLASGFLFSQKAEDFSVLTTFLYLTAAFGLFILGNFFISSIQDGKGSLRSIYIVTIYSFSPAIMLLPFLTLVLNALTYNEQFIQQMALLFIIAWVVSALMASLIQIHDYSFGKLIKNLLLTAFFMLVAILVLSLAYLLVKQIFTFIGDIITEVSLRD